MERPPQLATPSRIGSTAADVPAQRCSLCLTYELPESSLAAKASSCREWVIDFLTGFVAYYLTTLPVLLGVLFGIEFLHRPDRNSSISSWDPVAACFHFDAHHYRKISQQGYSYDPARSSVVAFFPAYPLLSRWVEQVSGLSAEESALLAAHLALIGAFVLLVRYVRLRWPEATPEQRSIVLAVFGLWPMGLFFRMPYAESLFACLSLALLYGMARGWPPLLLAFLAGLGTAVRPVGVALTAAFLWHVLTQPGKNPRAKMLRLLHLLPLACWGLLAYMSYQWASFGTPLAFAQTQEHWTFLAPPKRIWLAKLEALATLEPIWRMYVPGSPPCATRAGIPGDPFFSLIFWNPILFVLAAALLVLGGFRRWLNGTELVLGACLLVIPYLTRSYEMSMASHGRFASVAVVNYLVIARLLSQSAEAICTASYMTFGLALFIFTALYAANYLVY